MSIKIICIGKKHESWISEGVERYQKRLKKPYLIEWVILPHSTYDGHVARQNESSAILSRLSNDDYLILLDEQGKNISTPDLASVLTNQLSHSKPVVFVIGGAYGVDSTLHKRANFIWSLSNLVFPHQLVRLILAEQIYRAQEISAGNPYHHE